MPLSFHWFYHTCVSSYFSENALSWCQRLEHGKKMRERICEIVSQGRNSAVNSNSLKKLFFQKLPVCLQRENGSLMFARSLEEKWKTQKMSLAVETLATHEHGTNARRSQLNLDRPFRSWQFGAHVTRHFFQRLSVLLQRANASLIATRAPAPPPPFVIGS